MKILILSLLGLSLQAQTLLISDIDDTIKNAHVRSTKGIIKNAFKTNNIIKGMPHVYREIVEDTNATVYYLTNAPKILMKKSHTATVRNGKYPQGQILLRKTGVSSDEHKIIALNALMKKHNPTNVILFGDNGEKDIHFYKSIERKYPHINFITFIRIAYSLDANHSPLSNQFGYVSPFEVASVLNATGYIDQESLDDIYETHAQGYLADKMCKDSGHIYLPKWLTCKGHDANVIQDDSLFMAAQIKSKINNLCQ